MSLSFYTHSIPPPPFPPPPLIQNKMAEKRKAGDEAGDEADLSKRQRSTEPINALIAVYQLGDPELRLRLSAYSTLMKSPPSTFTENVIDAIVGQLKHAHPHTRQMAINLVFRVPSLEQNKKTMSLVLEMFHDEDEWVRNTAVSYLQKLPPATGIKDLIMERLGSPMCKVRVAALQTLGGMSDDTFTQHVLQAVKVRLTDESVSVRSAAVILLRKRHPDSITGDIVAVLKDRLADCSNIVRVETATTFINLPSSMITADVSSALLDRLKFNQCTGAPAEDFDETRARVIKALSFDHLKEEDLLLVVRNLRPELRNKDGEFVHYPESQEATCELLKEMLNHPAFTSKVAAEVERIVKEGPAFRLLAYMAAGSKESVYNMKLKDPNGQILMHYHGGP